MPDIYLYAGEANPNDVRLYQTNVNFNFDTATYCAISQLSDCFRNVRTCSLYAGNDGNLLAGYFDATQYHWTIPADRMGAGKVYRFDTNVLAWGISFKPTQQSWTIDSQRVPSPQPRPDTNRDVGWNIPNLDFHAWTIPADRLASSSYIWKTDTNHDLGWLTEDIFAPVPTFDPAFMPAIAELVGTRTPMAAQLAVVYYLALYDLGWVHDVIPLTDPVPGADVIYLRPIAPVMSARRRNKKRRR